MINLTSPIYLIRLYNQSLENWRISRSNLQREINYTETLRQQIIDNQPNTNPQRALRIAQMYDDYIKECKRDIDIIDTAVPIYTNARNDGLLSIVRSSHSKFSLMYPEYIPGYIKPMVGPFKDLPLAYFQRLDEEALWYLWEEFLLNAIDLM